MQIIKLYRYARPAGGVTVSPVKPDCEYTELFRLIADEGKLLTDGDAVAPCADVSDAAGWTEIDDPDAVDGDNYK